jgi:hypothetical protein
MESIRSRSSLLSKAALGIAVVLLALAITVRPQKWITWEEYRWQGVSGAEMLANIPEETNTGVWVLDRHAYGVQIIGALGIGLALVMAARR